MRLAAIADLAQSNKMKWGCSEYPPVQHGRGSKPIGSHFGVGEFTTHFRTHFSGDRDVLCGYDLDLTHGHIEPGSFQDCTGSGSMLHGSASKGARLVLQGLQPGARSSAAGTVLGGWSFSRLKLGASQAPFSYNHVGKHHCGLVGNPHLTAKI